MNQNSTSREAARELDQADPLRGFRDEFHLPHVEGQSDVYFVGNSLGLLPRRTEDYLRRELESWSRLAVRGHFTEPRPWVSYHELLTETMAQLVGGQWDEVVVMNSLTVNLHLMMATFYRPTARRNKILIEAHAFPSDKNAVESQIRLHGFEPEESLIEVEPDDNELFSSEKICETIRQHRDSLALVLLPGVQYYTGQIFDIERITQAAHQHSIPVGFDLAHAAGNVMLRLHDWDVDFACWCTYKYLNAGPGSVAGCFVNQRHANQTDLNRLAGWWGHEKETRFKMDGNFSAIPTAEGWQVSNPPILSLAAILGSLEIFDQAGAMTPLVKKSRRQNEFFRACLADRVGDRVRVISPIEMSGCQLSLVIEDNACDARAIHDALESRGIRTDWREPNVIRAAPTPLYNSFEEIWRFVDGFAELLDETTV